MIVNVPLTYSVGFLFVNPFGTGGGELAPKKLHEFTHMYYTVVHKH